MGKPRIGIIGGSGLGQAFAAEAGGHEVSMDTPFGPTSGPILTTNWAGVDIAFLSRHGPGHLLSPSAVPYRANIFALKQMGITHILASGAIGSLREGIEPRNLVICDQIIDKTTQRDNTFFDAGIATHVEFAKPFCPKLRTLLTQCGDKIDATVHPKGTYVCMEGPAFSTVAESKMHQSWGGDLIGMTCMPEAKLAREAEICYGLIALPTDYDCWRPHDPTKDQQALLEEIISNLHSATTNAIELLRVAVAELARQLDKPCRCQQALALAIWSDKSKINKATVDRLRPIIGRYFE